MSAQETDPLLPRGNSAPEVTGPGFSTPAKVQYFSQNEIESDERDESKVETDESEGGASPLWTLIALFSIVVGLALVITLCIPGVLGNIWGKPDPKGHDASNIRARVDKILTDTPLIDGHNDLAILIRYVYQNRIYDANFTTRFEDGNPPLPSHVDLPRLKDGKVGGSFWSAFLSCPDDGTNFSDANYAETVTATLSQLDLIRRLTVSHPNVFSAPELNSSNALAAFKDHKQIISPIGIEGLHQIGNSFSNLRLYHALGVKYATLTWNCHNAFADAALVPNAAGKSIAAPAYWGGLSERGQLAVQEMNRMGMIVDLSHVSKNTMLDVLGANPKKSAGSAAPIMFSHSSAYALCPHPRNVPDDVLQLVKKTNSIVMVNFSPDFVSCVGSDSESGLPDFYPANNTLHQVARHVIYIGDLIGYDHVGLGSDYDGMFNTPEGLEDVSKYPDLLGELLRMGLKDTDAAKVVGLNVLRVWGDVEKTALKMQKDGLLPVEDTIKPMKVVA